MKPFQHINVFSVEEAISTLKGCKGSTAIIAGGTDILGILKDQILPDQPEVLINIKTIPGQDYIKEDSTGLSIGSLVKLADLAGSPVVKEKYQLLAEAAQSVGTPQIRNMGTVGGNLCQDTRCWYYRYPHSIGGRILCLRKGSGPCHAVKGDNRYHALFSGRGCFTASPSDIGAALLALGAHIKTLSAAGSRIIPVEDFFDPLGNHVLEPEEMALEIRISSPPEWAKQKFLKYTVRKPVDFAIVSVATLVGIEEGICSNVQIALGAVAPGPLRASKTEAALKGKRFDPKTLQEAAELAVQDAKPLSMNGYKVELVKALVARALSSCL